MEIEFLDIDSLTPYINNARTHSNEQIENIANSITEFGFTNPVLIDSDGGIIAGHGRVMACEMLGINEIPCIRLNNLTPIQKAAYVIADNKIQMNAGWDYSLLKSELLLLTESEIDINLMGFSANEISSIMMEREEGENDEEDEWQGMPDFIDNELPERKVVVSFKNTDDFIKFFSIIGQSCTNKTKSIWFPEKEQKNTKDYVIGKK